MSRSRYDEIVDAPGEDSRLGGELGSMMHSRATERGSQELRAQSIGSIHEDSTGSFLQEHNFHRQCSHPSRFQPFSSHHGSQAGQRPPQRTQSSSAAVTPDAESFQLFDITHQSLWNSYAGPESCGPCPPSMGGSFCSSGSMFASTTGSIVGSEEVPCSGDARSALDQLSRFFNSRSLSDVTLKVGQRTFRSHRLVLASTSDVFERMFCSREWRESSRLELELHEEPDCERVFGSFLRFLYSRSVSLNADNSLPLLVLADKYNVDDLKQVCLKFAFDHVLGKIQLKEVFHLWFHYAVRNGHRNLTAACVALLAEKAEELMFSAEWESEWMGLEREQMVEIIKSSDLVVKDEKDVWCAVQLWMNRNNSLSRNGCGMVESASDKQAKIYSCELNSGPAGGFSLGRGSTQESPQTSSKSHEEEEDLRVVLPHIRFAMMTASQLCEIERSSLAERHPELFMRYINWAYKYLSLPLAARSRMPEFGGLSFMLRNYLDLRWDKRLVISNFHSYGDRSEVLLKFSTLACTVPAQSWEWELKVFPRGSNHGSSYTSDHVRGRPGEIRMILSSNMMLDQHPRPLEFQLGIVVNHGQQQQQQQKELVLISGRKNFCRGRFSAETTELDQRLSLNELTDQLRGRILEEAGEGGGGDCTGGPSPLLIDGSLVLQVVFRPIND